MYTVPYSTDTNVQGFSITNMKKTQTQIIKSEFHLEIFVPGVNKQVNLQKDVGQIENRFP